MTRARPRSPIVTALGYGVVVLAVAVATVWTAGAMGPFATITVAAVALAVLAVFDRWWRDRSPDSAE